MAVADEALRRRPLGANFAPLQTGPVSSAPDTVAAIADRPTVKVQFSASGPNWDIMYLPRNHLRRVIRSDVRGEELRDARLLDGRAHGLHDLRDALVHLPEDLVALGLIVLDEVTTMPEGVARLGPVALGLPSAASWLPAAMAAAAAAAAKCWRPTNPGFALRAQRVQAAVPELDSSSREEVGDGHHRRADDAKSVGDAAHLKHLDKGLLRYWLNFETFVRSSSGALSKMSFIYIYIYMYSYTHVYYKHSATNSYTCMRIL